MVEKGGNMKLAVVLFCCLFIVKSGGVGASLDHLEFEVEYQCIQHCPLQNRTDTDHYDFACDYQCNIKQCSKGCKQWRQALNTSCQSACDGPNERLTPKQLYCVMGCNDATNKYFAQIKSKLLTPPAPALVADSLNATSLKLEWSFAEARTLGLSCHLQWKYEELSAAWHYSRNATWLQDDAVVLVENLQPYTKYRFRVVLLLGHQDNLIVSNPSVVISTLASGIPVSPPSSVRVAPIDCTRISVSWEPGPFPHGPLLSYVVQIKDNHAIHSEVKDIPPENNFYMFRDLRPESNYTISIKMTNGVGSGPSAKVVVSTPSESLTKDTQQPVLILATEHGVIEQGTNVLDEPQLLYSTHATIRGIALHINRTLLFVSDSTGAIHRMGLYKRNLRTIAPLPLPPHLLPTLLSVDWLNDHLYILSEHHRRHTFQLLRSSLDGRALAVAVAGLQARPHSFAVDPYNGYLFWSAPAGLFRLPIASFSNGITHETVPRLIHAEPHLGAFTVDHANFRLLVANQKLNTIVAVSLDGSEALDIRPNVIKRHFEKVTSLATANRRFYWTNGADVFYEEYHNSDYFHNNYPDLSLRSYTAILINLTSSQPTPVPINPPIGVEAVFGRTSALVSWHPPHLLGIQAKGAWQAWDYQVAIKAANATAYALHASRNASTTIKIDDLTPDCEYSIKVSAFTDAGKSPWSGEFVGRTLGDKSQPVIVWSSNKGLLSTDSIGSNITQLIDKRQMSGYHFTDLTWYENLLFLVSNDSSLYTYNQTSKVTGKLSEVGAIGSIAVDWIGKKLYWSNPKRQMIIRGNLNGTQQEPLPILTLAKELNIDSVKAYLYWSTGFAVKCSHLNGDDPVEYHPVKLFSGKEVMGLTLDFDGGFVYWIVSSSDGSNLFRAPMAGYGRRRLVETVDAISRPIQEPLCYFHRRLLWLQDNNSAAISDLTGRNIATLRGEKGITLVYVLDRSHHPLPGTNLTVLPEPVRSSSIRIVGTLSQFNVTWSPSTNVNFGVVFYELSVENERNQSTMTTSATSVKYWQSVAPYTQLHVTIRAFTYWDTAAQARSAVYSPSSTPSGPVRLRAFVTHLSLYNDTMANIMLRWNAPRLPNGPIDGYQVEFGCDSLETDHVTITNSNKLQFELNKLKLSENCTFRVRAFGEAGLGDLSPPLSINSSIELPVPQLLIAAENAILIKDLDANLTTTILSSINTPISVVYLFQESKLFWINQIDDLMTYNSQSGGNPKKINDFRYFGTKSLTVDWLERTLYYIEALPFVSNVLKLDLNKLEAGFGKSEEILTISGNVSKLEVSPLSKRLFWLENDKLMTSDLQGYDIRPYFVNQTVKDFYLDQSTQNVYYINDLSEVRSDNQTLTLVDIYDQFAVDSERTYVKNASDLRILTKVSNHTETVPFFGHFFTILGPQTQPLPPKPCLAPFVNFDGQPVDETSIQLKYRSANSLTVILPELQQRPLCHTSFPTAKYHITIKSIVGGAKIEKTTFERTFTIEELRPWTNYTLSLKVSNFYHPNASKFGATVVFQTAIGAPSPPQNVSALVLNPTSAKVTWSPPKNYNGATVHYEIYWKTESTLSGLKPKEQPIVEAQFSPNSTQYLTTTLSKLSPNENYTIWVRAISETNETSNDSEIVQIRTYPEPSQLSLVDKSANVLKLSWQVAPSLLAYEVQVSEYSQTTNRWRAIPLGTLKQTSPIEIIANRLEPKTNYIFRLVLTYKNDEQLYVWPVEHRFIYQTLGDRPSKPGIPKIQYVKHNIYKVYWEAAKENGARIDSYRLEGLELPNYRGKRSMGANRTAFYHTAPSVEVEEREWRTFYNGSDTSWIIDGLSDKYKYEFRVLARNSYGWSEASDSSTAFDLNEAARMAEKQSPMTLIVIATLIPVSVCLFVILCIFCLIGRYSKPKKVQVVGLPRGPDVELATLRELPRRGVHNTNALYSATLPPSADLTLLPHIRRDQITLMKFLGSGAFGEVFEGKAKIAPNDEQSVKVAVKTLRKGASDQEKGEFLQEAQLMSNFRHEHILQLLGVCLDNDPHFIIMELMQGGDLLTYLRSSRNPSATDTPSLRLIDLLKMCVDVSKGCQYLEEMHFVHRDLACRNCLVSSMEDDRLVKIGDFGLARDIYKHDYYRKEGEGLLPVRWMAPESLKDGVFTSQSDVWAFGVLLWEIMTLGQQPYPARNNMEVFFYVKRGGRLGKPTDCPEILHNLMLKCWEYKAEERPMFKYCLQVLDRLHLENLKRPMTGAHEGQYISTVQECGEMGEDDGSREKTPFLGEKESNIPKYLELLYEGEDSGQMPSTTQLLPNDGYEIPNQFPQNDSSLVKSCNNQAVPS